MPRALTGPQGGPLDSHAGHQKNEIGPHSVRQNWGRSMRARRRTYREYLKENGIPIRFDLKTAEGMRDFRNSTKDHYNSLYAELSLSKEHRVLEIGCHYGAFVKYLNEKGVVPCAVDLDPKKIELLKNDPGLKGNFISGDAAGILPDRDQQYDYVFMNFVLEHIVPDKALDLLKMIQRSLKIGGRLFATVPNMENPFNLRLRYMEPTHRNGFTTESLIWAFYTAGFDDITCRDATQYAPQKMKRIRKFFDSFSDLLEIRAFHDKFSEALLCQGTKLFHLEEMDFGPYDS